MAQKCDHSITLIDRKTGDLICAGCGEVLDRVLVGYPARYSEPKPGTWNPALRLKLRKIQKFSEDRERKRRRVICARAFSTITRVLDVSDPVRLRNELLVLYERQIKRYRRHQWDDLAQLLVYHWAVSRGINWRIFSLDTMLLARRYHVELTVRYMEQEYGIAGKLGLPPAAVPIARYFAKITGYGFVRCIRAIRNLQLVSSGVEISDTLMTTIRKIIQSIFGKKTFWDLRKMYGGKLYCRFYQIISYLMNSPGTSPDSFFRQLQKRLSLSLSLALFSTSGSSMNPSTVFDLDSMFCLHGSQGISKQHS